jgi:hypothetical protein
VSSSPRDLKVYPATFGKALPKKQSFFGYRLHLLIIMSGLNQDFELSSDNCKDLEGGFELLAKHTDLEVLANNGNVRSFV